MEDYILTDTLYVKISSHHSELITTAIKGTSDRLREPCEVPIPKISIAVIEIIGIAWALSICNHEFRPRSFELIFNIVFVKYWASTLVGVMHCVLTFTWIHLDVSHCYFNCMSNPYLLQLTCWLWYESLIVLFNPFFWQEIDVFLYWWIVAFTCISFGICKDCFVYLQDNWCRS